MSPFLQWWDRHFAVIHLVVFVLVAAVLIALQFVEV